jgi:hypothetical protein
MSELNLPVTARIAGIVTAAELRAADWSPTRIRTLMSLSAIIAPAAALAVESQKARSRRSA